MVRSRITRKPSASNPPTSPSHSLTAALRASPRRSDGALGDYNEAIRIKPSYADAIYGRGNVLKAKGDLEGALHDYNEAIRLQPDYANAFYGRALIQKQGDKSASAIADFQKYLDLGGGVGDGFKEKAEEMIRELKKKL